MTKLDDIFTINMNSLRNDMEFAVYRLSELRNGKSSDILNKAHRINFDAMLYIEQGSGRHHIDYKAYKYQPGTAIYIAKYQVHYFDNNPELEGYAVLFNDHVFSNGSDDALQYKIRLAMESINCIDTTDANNLVLLEKLHKETRKKDELSREVIRALVRALLLDNLVLHYLTYEQYKCNDSRHYRRFKKVLEDHFYHTHKVSDYAEMIGVCGKSLNLVVKKQTGKTAKQLIDDRVLLELKRKLAFSQSSIHVISSELGFKEATNMTKFFRRHTDVTPKEFRQLCRCSLM